MKLVHFLSHLATIAILAAIAGLAFNTFALALFSVAIVAGVLLMLASDYAPGRTSMLAYARSKRRELLPLAA